MADPASMPGARAAIGVDVEGCYGFHVEGGDVDCANVCAGVDCGEMCGYWVAVDADGGDDCGERY